MTDFKEKGKVAPSKLVTKIAPVSRFSLIGQYRKDNRQKWALKFQQAPVVRIIFEGEEPTLPELIEVFGPLGLPIWMLPTLEVIIAYVRDQQAKEATRE